MPGLGHVQLVVDSHLLKLPSRVLLSGPAPSSAVVTSSTVGDSL
jgi:hypothetical protein